ncbi:MAG: CBS domain-containing protein [Desulfobacterales bacterium]|nr:CBS domain-containing protein [Desulfobacterales bacterium]MDD4072924.1 CBS domain-containing protein [Desulfobacterales bacterium]MDD4392173.1 CBS domain-containing protein [Desulfobacterales bacterium]
MSTGKTRQKQKAVTVITTHLNADYDALASLLAAQKLYPDAIVVFPGTQERNLRNFFVDSMAYLFNLAALNEVDIENIDTLVLVDTRQPSRIGKFSELLDKENLNIHIYDHHPEMPNDIRGSQEVICQTGATVTILTEILTDKGIHITSEEATLMCLGIYEDTGSFTFASTTERDFTAAATLLSKGANLNVVANLISRELSPSQVRVLNDMIQASSRYNINGLDIVVSTIKTDTYIPDFAFLVHKMVKMQDISAVFAAAQMGNKIYLVARSKMPQVDVGEILRQLGGGGHAFAASAAIREKTMAQVENQLLEILNQTIQARRHAKDIMSFPPITADAGISCKEAANLLTRYNINALLVTEHTDEKEILSGFISRQVIEKALYHQLEQVPVREYMSTEMAVAGPDSDIFEIQEKIITNKQRILPIMEGELVVGVVTRTDLLNILIQQSRDLAGNTSDSPEESLQARTRRISKFMKERLSDHIVERLRSIGEVADQLGYGVYVVGGFVRDLFLYRPNEDIDIVIEGNGIAFARTYARMKGARIHSHEKFGTAVITLPDGSKIDVASARMEYYQFPAALPTVEMSSIKLDLFRRDFTINTLSIQLNPEKFGTLIDFFAAQKDIKEKTIRVLHNLSFVEDPTRVFRAIRFEQRFGFTIGKLTAGLIKNAVKMDFFKRLSGKRVFTELRLILEEENPTSSMIKLDDYDLLKTIHPSIKLTDELISLFDSVKKVVAWFDLLFLNESYMRWIVFFLALLHQSNKQTSVEICQRLEISHRYRKIFFRERFKALRLLSCMEQHESLTNSLVYHTLSGFRTELNLYIMARTDHEDIKKFISNYFTHLRYMKPTVSGGDLKQLGLEPGPVYKDILQAVLDARLNGLISSREEELEFVRHYVSKH